MSVNEYDNTAKWDMQSDALPDLDPSSFLDSLLSAVDQPVICLDAANRPIRANTAAILACGFDSRKAVQDSDSDFVDTVRKLNIRHLDGRPIPIDDLLTTPVQATRTLQDQRLLFRNAAGVDCLVSLTATPLVTHDRVIGTLVTWRDVFDREHLLDQLEAAREQARTAIDAHLESDERFRAVGGVVPFGLWTATSVGQLVFVSDSFREAIGLPLEAFQGSGWTERVRPEDLEPMLASWKDCMETGGVRDYEYKIRDKYGEYRSILTRGVPSRDAAGNITSWVGIQLDVTERRRVLEALADSEERARAQYKGFPVPTYSWQRSGNDFVLVDYNDTAYEITRGRIKERIGIEASRVYAETPELADDIAKCWADRTTIRRETQFQLWSTGERKELALTYVFVPTDIVMMHTEDITARKLAERELQDARDQLEARVRDRTAELRSAIAERELAVQQMKASREQLRSLAARVESVREEERTRIAREIHDELGQMLTGIKIDVSWLQNRLSRLASGNTRASVAARIHSTLQQIDEAVRSVRRIATELRPGILDTLGLTAAIEWQTKDLEQRTGIVCHFCSDLGGLRIDEELSTALFRILQEALTNVVRHANATEVHVMLERDTSQLRLRVEDNGTGMSPSRITEVRSLGFLGMRERARQFGGDVTITSTSRLGTSLTVCIPLHANKQW